MTAYDDVLARRAAAAGPLQLQGGSGYFAARAPGLDPALFAGDQLRSEVRFGILGKLYGFWATRYNHPREWSTAWIAGSGITTAWNADREAGDAPGDLDVLIGVDYASFFRHNTAYQGNPEDALAHHFNQQLHDELWPLTERTSFNGSTYELTFYVNPGGTDIRDINPYAAYDVSHDRWTVHPVEVPRGFSEDYFSGDAQELTRRDALRAQGILTRFNHLQQQLAQSTPGTPQHVNLAAALHTVVRDGAAHFDDVHDGRRAAFRPDGKGYFDVANYRWQAGKGNGSVNVMRQLKQLDERAHRDMAMPCADTGHLLLVAGLVNGHGGR